MARHPTLRSALLWTLIVPAAILLFDYISGRTPYGDWPSIIALVAAALTSIILDALLRPLRRRLSSVVADFASYFVLYTCPAILFLAIADPQWFGHTIVYIGLAVCGVSYARLCMRFNRVVSEVEAKPPTAAPAPRTASPDPAVPERRFTNPFWNEEDRDRRMAEKLWVDDMIALVFMMLAIALFLSLLVVILGPTFYSFSVFSGIMGIYIYVMWKQLARSKRLDQSPHTEQETNHAARIRHAAQARNVIAASFTVCVVTDVCLWFLWLPPGASRFAATGLLGVVAGILLCFWGEFDNRTREKESESPHDNNARRPL